VPWHRTWSCRTPTAQALVARLKIMADLDISEHRKPQDGKIDFAKFSAQNQA
jgi:type II secretory ATPase GspE/PulE/Tfp pilus assembly ATPase PilB-like protein